MAVRSLTEIWVDANFKETQLADLRIGQPVDLDVDMYGSRQRFKGRISGFTMGTGSTLALLPAGECDRQLRQGRAAAAGADRPDRLRSGQDAAVHRPVGHAVRARQRAADRAGRGQGAASRHVRDRSRRPRRRRSHECRSDRSVPLARRAVSPWLVAVAVVIPTFMEVLDTTIANVALRYIAGGLSAPVTDSEWVITSYLAANAIILPISGWLATAARPAELFPALDRHVHARVGACAGWPRSLSMLIAFRVLQGLAGGGLQPSSQGVLLDAFPQEKQGAAMTLFGMAALLAPVVGPTLGGYITDNYGWRWIFYLNVPVGLLALFHVPRRWSTIRNICKSSGPSSRKRRQPFDTLGLCLLSVTMVCWEVMLSKGQEWDWLGDPFYRVQTLLVLFVLGLGGLIYRELRIANPLINFRTLADRNFRSCCIIIFCAYGVLYANTTSLPGAAAIAVRLRRDDLGPGALAGGSLCDRHAVRRRRAADRAASMRAI